VVGEVATWTRPRPRPLQRPPRRRQDSDLPFARCVRVRRRQQRPPPNALLLSLPPDRGPWRPGPRSLGCRGRGDSGAHWREAAAARHDGPGSGGEGR
jgi:hypothetical protein